MNELIKIEEARPLDGHWLRLRFSDGAVKDVDLSNVVARGGVFEPLRANRAIFQQVRVNPETGTVEWPGEVDLDAEVLYGRSEPESGVAIPRRDVEAPAPAHAASTENGVDAPGLDRMMSGEAADMERASLTCFVIGPIGNRHEPVAPKTETPTKRR